MGAGTHFVHPWIAVEAFAFAFTAAPRSCHARDRRGVGLWKEVPWRQLLLQFKARRDLPWSCRVTVCGGSCAKQRCCSGSVSFQGPGTKKLAGCLSAPLPSRRHSCCTCRRARTAPNGSSDSGEAATMCRSILVERSGVDCGLALLACNCVITFIPQHMAWNSTLAHFVPFLSSSDVQFISAERAAFAI